jgi:hypothetical protein
VLEGIVMGRILRRHSFRFEDEGRLECEARLVGSECLSSSKSSLYGEFAVRAGLRVTIVMIV